MLTSEITSRTELQGKAQLSTVKRDICELPWYQPFGSAIPAYYMVIDLCCLESAHEGYHF